MKKITTLVLDASVAVKQILEEDHDNRVKKIFYLKDEFKLSVLVPDIFRYEFFNTVTRLRDKATAFKTYEMLSEYQFSVIPLEKDLIQSANRIMEKYPKVSFYDTVYHALAKAYDVDFITADETYYKKVKKEGNIKLLKNLKI